MGEWCTGCVEGITLYAGVGQTASSEPRMVELVFTAPRLHMGEMLKKQFITETLARRLRSTPVPARSYA